jgi:hypothetical protein
VKRLVNWLKPSHQSRMELCEQLHMREHGSDPVMAIPAPERIPSMDLVFRT